MAKPSQHPAFDGWTTDDFLAAILLGQYEQRVERLGLMELKGVKKKADPQDPDVLVDSVEIIQAMADPQKYQALLVSRDLDKPRVNGSPVKPKNEPIPQN